MSGVYKDDESTGMVLLAGNSHPDLARLVSEFAIFFSNFFDILLINNL